MHHHTHEGGGPNQQSQLLLRSVLHSRWGTALCKSQSSHTCINTDYKGILPIHGELQHRRSFRQTKYPIFTRAPVTRAVRPVRSACRQYSSGLLIMNQHHAYCTIPTPSDDASQSSAQHTRDKAVHSQVNQFNISARSAMGQTWS